MSDIKSWNKLRSNRVQAGTRLKIRVEQNIAVVQKIQKNNSVKESSEETKPELIKENTADSKEYVVKAGDNLTKIAKEHKLYVADLKKWNNLKDNQVQLGDVLKLAPSEANAIDKEIVAETIFYTVKKGDNLTKIAQLNHVDVSDIKTWNNLQNNTVQVGEKLKIEKQSGKWIENNRKANIKKASQEFKMYVVEKGDSLYSISLKNKTTVADLKEQNNMKDENLQPGMKLKIKG
jgi:membrane-bound lytic murein transglycosylase D